MLLPVAVALGLATVASAAGVDAGSLVARTTGDPWSLEFTDGAGKEVLSEAPGTASCFCTPSRTSTRDRSLRRASMRSNT